MEIEWLCVDADGYKIANVYKPPPTLLQVSDIPVFPHPYLYAGDFNCHHIDWVCDANSADGTCLVGWASTNNLALLFNLKDAGYFYFGCWNTSTNPDFAFVSIDSDRRVLEKFPRSQHRPSLITPPRYACPVPSIPVKPWNFLKAKWNHYIALTNRLSRTLSPPELPDMDHAYRCFCNAISTAAKKCIPRSRRNNRIPCWNIESKNLYQTFLQYLKGHKCTAATALLARLDRKRKNQWCEAVQNIDFHTLAG